VLVVASRFSTRGPFDIQRIDVLLCDPNSPFVNRGLDIASRFRGLSHALPVMQIGGEPRTPTTPIRRKPLAYSQGQGQSL
jgi:hypothetical protein